VGAEAELWVDEEPLHEPLHEPRGSLAPEDVPSDVIARAPARLGFTFAMLIIGVGIRMLSIPVLRSGIIAVSVLGGALVYVVNRG